jgi:hypothetical protein
MAIERDRVEDDLIVDRSTSQLEGLRVSWGGIWAGTLVVLGTLLLLTTLGLAVGISANARNVSAGALNTGAAVWSGASLLIALFVGGVAATRMSMVWDRFTGLWQGALVWVTSLVTILVLNAAGVGLVFGSALGIATRAAQQLSAIPTANAWVSFVAVLLSLLAALAGAALGRRRAAERVGRPP